MGIHPKHGKMDPVYPPLADVARLAIKYVPIDITVLSSTLRLWEEQKAYVKAGTSRTLDSLHLPQADGYVHAVDLGALERGTVSWRPEVYFAIAEAVQIAARELNVDVIWGGAWTSLNSPKSVEELHAEYIALVAARPPRADGTAHRPFFDGPHFEVRELDNGSYNDLRIS